MTEFMSLVLSIAGIGLLIFGAAALRSDWLSAVSGLLLFALLVGGALRIGPFRKRSGGGEPT